ncbi:glycosyltransferase family 39 protein, partial [Patescibacteria group bacterium]|nr:glycosyltransferase family 39 protein [Patescibacteria group bacterium]
LFFNNTISIASAIFMAFEPFSLFWSSTVMSETPFLFLFMLSVYLLALSWKNQKWKYIILSAIFLGLAAWIRQIAFLFYPAIVVMTFIMLWRKIALVNIIKILVVFLFVFLAITAPWCIRNKIQFDSYVISNQTHLLYFFNVVPNFLALSTNLSVDQAEEYINNLAVTKAGVDNFNDIYLKDEYIPILKEINSSIIRAQPLIFLKFHLIKALPALTDSGWTNILNFWNIDLGDSSSINISNLLVQKDFQTLFSSLKNMPTFWVRIIGIIFWLLIDLIALIGVVLMIRNKKLLRIALAMLVIIGYFFITSSWAAMARLRLPLQPFLFIFVIYAIYYFIKSYENKRRYTN